MLAFLIALTFQEPVPRLLDRIYLMPDVVTAQVMSDPCRQATYYRRWALDIRHARETGVLFSWADEDLSHLRNDTLTEEERARMEGFALTAERRALLAEDSCRPRRY